MAWVRLFSHYVFKHPELILLELAHRCHLLVVHALWLVQHALLIMIMDGFHRLLQWCGSYRLADLGLVFVHGRPFIPGMVVAFGSSFTDDFKWRIISVDVAPVMIHAGFISSAYFDDRWFFVPVVILTVGAIFAYNFCVLTLTPHLFQVFDVFGLIARGGASRSETPKRSFSCETGILVRSNCVVLNCRKYFLWWILFQTPLVTADFWPDVSII